MANAEGKQHFADLREAVAKAVNRADPVGLLKMGCPADEYAPEIGSVIPRLSAASSRDDVMSILHEEFTRWFGERIAGEPGRYATAAPEIWNYLETSESRKRR